MALVVLLPLAVLQQTGAADGNGSDLGISRCGTQTVIVRGSAAYRAYMANATAAFCRAHGGVAPKALSPHADTRCTGTPVGVYGSSAMESFIVQAAEGFCQQQITQGTPAANAADERPNQTFADHYLGNVASSDYGGYTFLVLHSRPATIPNRQVAWRVVVTTCFWFISIATQCHPTSYRMEFVLADSRDRPGGHC